MSEIVLQANNLFKSFKSAGGPEVMNDISLTVSQGETIAITGSSGCGKSTLLHILGGLANADSGVVEVNGTNLAKLGINKMSQFHNRDIGFVYQFHHLLAEFTTVENVAMPLIIAGMNKIQAIHQATELLTRLDLQKQINMMPGKLSGGERQRVAIVRALANKPKLVIADEPTGNLDRKTANNVFSLLIEKCREVNASLIIASHDTELTENLDTKLKLIDGKLIA